MFIGRNEELTELNRRYNSKKFEMGVIYGSRRIGKTSLLKEFVKDKLSIYFQAKESNELDNRTSFSILINKLIGNPYSYVYPSYSECFDVLLKYANDEPIVIVIDEIAFLTQSYKGFLSELQYNIDHKFINSQVKLILSGSIISFMKDIIKNKRGPLFQRSTFQIKITKLLYNDALKFLDGLTSEDKIKYLSMFREHPFYLAMIDKNISFNDNIYNLLFNKYGNLVDVVDKVLPTGTKNQNTYNTILKAIAHRKKTNKEIADYIGKTPNYVATYLTKLVANESFDKNQKRNYYEINDNLINFWYRFIFNDREEILLNLGKVIYTENLESIELFISIGFEQVALSYMNEKNTKGLLNCYYEILRNYKVDNSKLGRSIELDGLARGIGKSKDDLLVVECKYRNKLLSNSVLEHLLESISIFHMKNHEIYLFLKSGFADDILENKENNIHLISIDDMVNDNL